MRKDKESFNLYKSLSALISLIWRNGGISSPPLSCMVNSVSKKKIKRKIMNLSIYIKAFRLSYQKERGVYLVHFKGDEIYTPLMDKIKQIHPGSKTRTLKNLKLWFRVKVYATTKRRGTQPPRKG